MLGLLGGAPLLAALMQAPAPELPVPTSESPPVVASTPVRRERIELLAGVHVQGGGSTWRGDGTGGVGLTLGVRLFRVVAPFVQARLGYAGVDQRLLIPLVIGVTLGVPIPPRGPLGEAPRAWPYLRAAFVHQHEESVAAVADNLAGALLGIGGGIRHRAGALLAAGCDFTLLSSARARLLLGPEVSFLLLGYSVGPTLYGHVGINLGGSFRLL